MAACFSLNNSKVLCKSFERKLVSFNMRIFILLVFFCGRYCLLPSSALLSIPRKEIWGCCFLQKDRAWSNTLSAQIVQVFAGIEHYETILENLIFLCETVGFRHFEWKCVSSHMEIIFIYIHKLSFLQFFSAHKTINK